MFGTVQEQKMKEVREKALSYEKIFQEKIPAGWKVRVEVFQGKAPYLWKEDKKSVGFKLIFTKPSVVLQKKKPYAEYLDESEQYENASPQMTRYLYLSLNSSYSYGMVERIHPDTLYNILNDLIIIEPSFVNGEGDFQCEEVEKLFIQVFKVAKMSESDNSLILTRDLKKGELETIQKDYPEKKAVQIHKTDNGRFYFEIITLR